MDKQAVKRRVRIAVSVFFAVVAIGLCVLWAMSYRDRMFATLHLPTLPPRNNFFVLITGRGSITVYLLKVDPQTYRSGVSFEPIVHQPSSQSPLLVFGFILDPIGEYILYFPLWVPILTSVALGSACWPRVQRFHFSLRTMLIATTLVAVVLGLVCYTVR